MIKIIKLLFPVILSLIIPISTVDSNDFVQLGNIQGVPCQARISQTERKYTTEELELLAHLLMAEAGSDYIQDEMIYGVGTVVMNRIDSPKFPDTLQGVIYQPGQYQCTWDGGIHKQPTERCYRIAKEILNGYRSMPSNVIWQAEFKQGSGIYTQIQNMIFCYE